MADVLLLFNDFAVGPYNLESLPLRHSSGKYDIYPSGQGLADRLEGFPPHQDCMTHCRCFEKFKILGEMPGDTTGVADDPVFRHRNYCLDHEGRPADMVSIASAVLMGSCRVDRIGSY